MHVSSGYASAQMLQHILQSQLEKILPDQIYDNLVIYLVWHLSCRSNQGTVNTNSCEPNKSKYTNVHTD